MRSHWEIIIKWLSWSDVLHMKNVEILQFCNRKIGRQGGKPPLGGGSNTSEKGILYPRQKRHVEIKPSLWTAGTIRKKLKCLPTMFVYGTDMGLTPCFMSSAGVRCCKRFTTSATEMITFPIMGSYVIYEMLQAGTQPRSNKFRLTLQILFGCQLIRAYQALEYLCLIMSSSPLCRLDYSLRRNMCFEPCVNIRSECWSGLRVFSRRVKMCWRKVILWIDPTIYITWIIHESRALMILRRRHGVSEMKCAIIKRSLGVKLMPRIPCISLLICSMLCNIQETVWAGKQIGVGWWRTGATTDWPFAIQKFGSIGETRRTRSPVLLQVTRLSEIKLSLSIRQSPFPLLSVCFWVQGKAVLGYVIYSTLINDLRDDQRARRGTISIDGKNLFTSIDSLYGL